jgi:hypothetical protein
MVHLFTPIAHAATVSLKLTNPLGSIDTLPKFIVAILKVVIAVGFPVLVLMIVYSGFLFITAQGNKESVEKAKKAFTWTVIGGAVLLGALAIAELLRATIEQISPTGTSGANSSYVGSLNNTNTNSNTGAINRTLPTGTSGANSSSMSGSNNTNTNTGFIEGYQVDEARYRT